MHVLLDECARGLRNELLGHDVRTFCRSGWAGVKNGELVQLAAGHFDLLLTVDRNLEHQQNLAGLALAVIVVHAPSNDIAVLRPLMPAVLAVISEAKPGMVTHIHGPTLVPPRPA
jgi:hypothetical protein